MTKPVLIIPGLGGSLLVNVKKPTKTIFKKEVLYNRWLNLHPYSPSYMMQWKEDMQCELKLQNRVVVGYKNYNPDIQPYDLYGINGIQNLVGDFELLNKGYQDTFENMFHYRYFYKVNGALLSKGYTPREDLIGFPWDFRLILDPIIRLRTFALLHHKISEVVKHQGEKITIVTHSIGGIFFKWFLEEYTTEEWVHSHIERLVLANAPFGGTPSTIKAVLVGEYYLPFLNKLFVDELRFNSSIIMSLPNPIAYHTNEIFWKTDKENINIHQYRNHMDENISFQLWNDLYKSYLQIIAKPNSIPTTIFKSIGIETPSKFYSKTLTDVPYKVEYTDGDGTVPSTSLSTAANIFPNHTIVSLKHVGHSDVISHPLFISNIMEHL